MEGTRPPRSEPRGSNFFLEGSAVEESSVRPFRRLRERDEAEAEEGGGGGDDPVPKAEAERRGPEETARIERTRNGE